MKGNVFVCVSEERYNKNKEAIMKRSKYIDHTLLKPEATKEQIKELCQQDGI